MKVKPVSIAIGICVCVLVTGCGTGKDPFSRLSSSTTRNDIRKKFTVDDYYKDDNEDWADDVSFLDYAGKMHFEYPEADNDSHLREATWYYEPDKNDANRSDVLSEIFSYLNDNKDYTYEGHGTFSGDEYYKWEGNDGSTFTLYDMSSVFLLYEPMG